MLSYASKLGPVHRLFQDYLFLSWTHTTLRCCTILLSTVDRVYDSGPIGFEGAKKILSLRTFMLLLLLSIMGSLSGVSRHVCVLCLPKKSLSYNNQQVCPPTHMCIHTYNTYIVKTHMHYRLAYRPTWWRQFLSWEFLFPNSPLLCEADIKPTSTPLLSILRGGGRVLPENKGLSISRTLWINGSGANAKCTK